MSRETFEILCNELQPHIGRQMTRLRQPISVDARVAITIWRLGTNTEYRTIAALFGIGRSTACEVVLETCEAIALHLIPKYVCIPQNEKLRETIDGFRCWWGFPQTVGAIDGTHIPILWPQECASDYYNRKGYYSILMQATVDFRGLFMDVNIGWPGKCMMLVFLFILHASEKGAMVYTLFPDWPITLAGVKVQLLLLGNPTYPLLPWLMKPYLDNASTTPQEHHFNYRLSRARMVVENSFGCLKGRWRCLLKRLDLQTSNIPNVVASCVVLLNV